MSDNYPPDWDERRRDVYARDDYTCVNCGAKGGSYGNTELHAHHVVPISSGGSHQKENLVTVCKQCHNAIHGDVQAPTSAKTTTVSKVGKDELTKKILELNREGLPEKKRPAYDVWEKFLELQEPSKELGNALNDFLGQYQNLITSEGTYSTSAVVDNYVEKRDELESLVNDVEAIHVQIESLPKESLSRKAQNIAETVRVHDGKSVTAVRGVLEIADDTVEVDEERGELEVDVDGNPNLYTQLVEEKVREHNREYERVKSNASELGEVFLREVGERNIRVANRTNKSSSGGRTKEVSSDSLSESEVSPSNSESIITGNSVTGINQITYAVVGYTFAWFGSGWEGLMQSFVGSVAEMVFALIGGICIILFIIGFLNIFISEKE